MTDWKRESILDLIRHYRKQEALWNTHYPDYRCKDNKTKAWEAISEAIGVPVNECHRKILSLLSCYRRELSKIRKAEEEGDENYQPRWFFYKSLAFLRTHSEIRRQNDYQKRHMASGSWKELKTDENSMDEEYVVEEDRLAEEDFKIELDANDDSLERWIPTEIPVEVETEKVYVDSLPELSSNRTKPKLRKRTPSPLQNKKARTSAVDIGEDELDIFGRFIATELRGLNEVEICVAKHKIHSVIYEVKMAKLGASEAISTNAKDNN